MFYLEIIPTVKSTQKEFQVSSFHKGRGGKKNPQTTTYTIIPVDPKYTFFCLLAEPESKVFHPALSSRARFASGSELNTCDDE